MLSSVIRHHWWPKQVSILGQHGKKGVKGFASSNVLSAEVDQSKLYVVAVMPCTAKKDEIARKQFQMANGQYETDAVLTVRELARVIELRGVAKRDDYVSFLHIPELVYDNPFGESTGAAIIFGATGGVMEAALRTAADVLHGSSLDDVKYDSVRGLFGIKESTVRLGRDKEVALSVAVCHQMKNVREFLQQIEIGEKKYHFIEVMTCPGGCIGGGGLPQSRDSQILQKRTESIYSLDERMVKRKSHENGAVIELYKELLGEPLSHTSHELLHTHYFPRPRIAPVALKAPVTAEYELDGNTTNTVCVVYGTQSGTAAQAAKEIKQELQQFVARSKV
jgi:iron only hydrogenase large subunit-like protein